MRHDGIEVSTGDGERIEFIPSPDFLSGDYNHWVNAEKRFGTLKQIEFQHKNIKLWLNHYEVAKDTTLKIRVPDLPLLSLSFTLGADVHYSIKGIPIGVSRMGYYNMITTPSVDIEISAKPGQVIVLFGINFSKEDLINSGVPPVLVSILNSALAGRTELLSQGEYLILKKMVEPIDVFKNGLYNGTISSAYPFEYLISNLVFNSFEAAGWHTNDDAKSGDIELLKTYIEENLSTVTVPELANHAHCNAATLRLLFLKHTKLTTSKYIKKVKMEKAKEMVVEGNELIENIGKAIGYSKTSFSSAFKNYHKIWPKDLRKSHKRK